jgi:hypothetical protein
MDSDRKNDDEQDFSDIIKFLEKINGEDVKSIFLEIVNCLPVRTYLGYPHIVYLKDSEEIFYPCTVEILTLPNGEESFGWMRGKGPYKDDEFDFLKEGLL